jgi:TPP-dependent pyruvate/acetoin dehydrogenase alpha subunit
MIENKAPATTVIAPPTGERIPNLQLQIYYFLQLTRQLETRLERLFRQNKVVGSLYSSLGQEAISVGSASALEPRDWLAPMIRNIGALLVKGFQPRDIFTQHMGKFTSPTRGKDGTSHFADLKTRHTVAPSSMLGDLIPVMTGVAMAARYLGHKAVALTWIGEGGSSTGAFHEGMNLAAAQRAPVVVILENNQWAYSTPVAKQSGLKDFAKRADAYGIRNSIVDGNDVMAVYRAAKEAVAECRAGRGPFLIEAKTMRMKGHAQHDSADYVPAEMMAYWKARDPIARFEKYLTENNLWTAEQKGEIDARIERELDEEQKIAEQAPMPPPETAAEGVYCDRCHTITADWRRPKGEVTPPATETKAVWRINDFGAALVAPPQAPIAPQAPPAPAPKPQQTPKPEPKQHKPQHPTHKPKHGPKQQHQNAKPSPVPTPRLPLPEEIEEDREQLEVPAGAPGDAPANAPLRVPFGRGPKDRAFLAEQPPPQAPQYRGRGHRPPQPSPSSRGPHKNSPKRHQPPRGGKRKP